MQGVGNINTLLFAELRMFSIRTVFLSERHVSYYTLNVTDTWQWFFNCSRRTFQIILIILFNGKTDGTSPKMNAGDRSETWKRGCRTVKPRHHRFRPPLVPRTPVIGAELCNGDLSAFSGVVIAVSAVHNSVWTNHYCGHPCIRAGKSIYGPAVDCSTGRITKDDWCARPGFCVVHRARKKRKYCRHCWSPN